MQRRPLIGYWRTPDGPAVTLRLVIERRNDRLTARWDTGPLNDAQWSMSV